MGEQFLERDATIAALMLDPIFTYGGVPPWIYEPGRRFAIGESV